MEVQPFIQRTEDPVNKIRRVVISPPPQGKQSPVRVRLEFVSNESVSFELPADGAAALARALLKALSGPGQQRLTLVKP